MPDLLFVPSTASQSEIVDAIDRARLGDLLILQGRVLGLTALSTIAISTGASRSADRRWFKKATLSSTGIAALGRRRARPLGRDPLF